MKISFPAAGDGLLLLTNYSNNMRGGLLLTCPLLALLATAASAFCPGGLRVAARAQTRAAAAAMRATSAPGQPVPQRSKQAVLPAAQDKPGRE